MTASGPVDWDAETYHQVAAPQEEWARDVLARLELEGNERVLDAGCGAGGVTRLLLERLPEGEVVGVDGSPSMIEHAREALAEFGDRAELIVGDLLELDLDPPVDAIFSNATFHWIPEHQRLFDRLYANLRPGGVLEAQCGGEGNVAEFKRAIEAVEGYERFADYLRGIPDTYFFASVGDTRARLERTGFEVGRVWLERRTVTPPDPAAFVRTVGLAKHIALLPPELHDDFVDTVLGSMARPLTLEYVRLNMSARRPA